MPTELPASTAGVHRWFLSALSCLSGWSSTLGETSQEQLGRDPQEGAAHVRTGAEPATPPNNLQQHWGLYAEGQMFTLCLYFLCHFTLLPQGPVYLMLGGWDTHSFQGNPVFSG